jgi:hypothetical protein
MTLPDSLIGHWSAFAYKGYGSMEDEQFVFLPDDTGWYAFERGFLCKRETFRWSLGTEGGLWLEGREYARVGDQLGTFVVQPSELRVVHLALTLGEEVERRVGSRGAS